ncbi:hypothetical protein LDVICp068 [lymphocystis disease virus-China]|uniref:Uncharacterized protein n=1 Tax=lymphocystis disease virus-China TaxID=256729 RepID=Q678E3_9VIRU|nr:hypothetical protein LDVICp068 [lymphocystis disease virus-China]AAU10914.1 hypothetical protein [lymphocystis disease virus-China]
MDFIKSCTIKFNEGISYKLIWNRIRFYFSYSLIQINSTMFKFKFSF